MVPSAYYYKEKSLGLDFMGTGALPPGIMFVLHYLPHVERLVFVKSEDSIIPAEIESRFPLIKDVGDSAIHTFRSVKVELGSELECNQPYSFPDSASLVTCRLCGHELVCGYPETADGTLRIRSVPGRDWMELVDCWSCHKSEFAVVTQTLAYSHETGEILPREGYILQRGMYFFASSRNCVGFTPEGACAGCGITGMGEALRESGQLTTTHLRICLGDVKVHNLHQEQLATAGGMQLLMTELLDLQESQGVSQFRLQSPNHSDLDLGLISWGTYMATSDGTGQLKKAAFVSVGSSDEEGERVRVNERIMRELKQALEWGYKLADRLGYGSNQLSALIY